MDYLLVEGDKALLDLLPRLDDDTFLPKLDFIEFIDSPRFTSIYLLDNALFITKMSAGLSAKSTSWYSWGGLLWKEPLEPLIGLSSFFIMLSYYRNTCEFRNVLSPSKTNPECLAFTMVVYLTLIWSLVEFPMLCTRRPWLSGIL